MDKKETYIVKCPYCGAEYHPAEILDPDSLLGHPKDIRKDGDGTILYMDSPEPDSTADYVCDYCNRRFAVEAKVEYKAIPDEFEEEYSTDVYSGRVGLKED